MSHPTYTLEVTPTLPDNIHRLKELANDLVYSWHRETRALFFSLDQALWKTCNHNPGLFLRRVDQDKLDAAATNKDYLQRFQKVLRWYDHYRSTELTDNELADNENPKAIASNEPIAYFCAEFGLHESLPTYSSGLGILAGDHCKAASDLSLPLVAIGLLYHQGYFTQKIDANGIQQAHYQSQDFVNLPVELLRDENHRDILIKVPIDDRDIDIRLWRVNVGRINLYLLDSDVPSNTPEDRRITKRLYDGSPGARINQEIVLGIGGV